MQPVISNRICFLTFIIIRFRGVKIMDEPSSNQLLVHVKRNALGLSDIDPSARWM